MILCVEVMLRQIDLSPLQNGSCNKNTVAWLCILHPCKFLQLRYHLFRPFLPKVLLVTEQTLSYAHLSLENTPQLWKYTVHLMQPAEDYYNPRLQLLFWVWQCIKQYTLEYKQYTKLRLNYNKKIYWFISLKADSVRAGSRRVLMILQTLSFLLIPLPSTCFPASMWWALQV